MTSQAVLSALLHPGCL